MMISRLCLLRGINVGGRNILPMKDLADLLDGLGCDNVATYIQSGNVVFQHEAGDSSVLERQISDEVLSRFGFEPQVLIISVRDFEAAVATNPYLVTEQDAKTVHLFFLSDCPTDPDFDKLNSLKGSSERFKLIDRVFYLHAPDGIGRSKLASSVEKLLGVPATARNWRTVLKLLDMARLSEM